MSNYLIHDTVVGEFIKPGAWWGGDVCQGITSVVIDKNGKMDDVDWDNFLTVIYPDQCIFVPISEKGESDFIHSLPVEDIIELECNLGYEVRREVVSVVPCVVGCTVTWDVIMRSIDGACCEISVKSVRYGTVCALFEMINRYTVGVLHTPYKMHCGAHPIIKDNTMALEMVLKENDRISEVESHVEPH